MESQGALFDETDDGPAALAEAIKRVGSGRELGRRLTPPISGQAVSLWRRVPVEPFNRVLQIERITGISRYRLRPDIYPAPGLKD